MKPAQIFHIILLLLWLMPALSWAQVKKLPPKPKLQKPVNAAETSQDTTKSDKILVDHSDFAEGEIKDDEETRYLKGNVELRQGDVYMYCDTAIIKDNNVTAVGHVIIQQGDSLNIFSDSLVYKGDSKIADLFGDVVLENNDQKLFTNRLNYNLNTKVAKYFSGATLTDDKTQLTSKIGYFYVDEDKAFFKDSVTVVDSLFTLRSDTLEFNTKSKIANFHGPTLISQNDSRIYCESGFYNTTNSDAEFLKNPQYEKDGQKATADIIRYVGATKEVLLEGNAKIIEEDKIAYADKIRYDEINDISYLEGNAHYEDATQVIDSDKIIYDGKSDVYTTAGRSRLSDPPQILLADNIDYDSDSEMGIASGNVYWQDTTTNISIVCEQADYNKQEDFIKASGGRPLLTTLMDGDSMFLSADTLLAFKENPEDEERMMHAISDVRIYKSDMQAVCDSLIYNAKDSLFQFYNDPIIWSDTSQFMADTIHMEMANSQIDKIYLYNNAFIINTPEQVYFNQIKGKNITAFFVENELARMKVDGNAESIYYATDESGAYIAVNKTICSEMLLYFSNNKVDNIKFFAAPKANMYPMGKVAHKKEMRLAGFLWETERRPMSIEDLLMERTVKIVDEVIEEDKEEVDKENSKSKETEDKLKEPIDKSKQTKDGNK